MAQVQIIKKQFTNEETGRVIDYERLAIIGNIDGLPYTLELKLEPAELIAAKMLLASNGNVSTVETRKANSDETPHVSRSSDILSDDNIGSLFD